MAAAGWRMRRSRVWGDTGLLLNEVLVRIRSSRWPVHVGVARYRGGGELRAPAVWAQRRAMILGAHGVLKTIGLVGLRSGWPRAQIGTGLHC
jgi:hypothetical protein